ncbi:MAG TPA: adenosylmethionine--8-amino-7-oxononanoate transaminase [Myxococcales bacterium]|jgi:adenosylmethionine-8-amino-7-oxononanoate aminotransferase|nr:adenosylmethionine--8-amino-7-oxononanoate transaminase [Myxococcales bacterium]
MRETLETPEARHERLAALDRAHVWHPFTQMQTWLDPLPGDEPLIIDHGRGSWLFDTRGRRYLDAISSLWVNVHGHRKAEIDSAIKLQLSSVAHSTLLGLASPPSIELAAELAARAPKAEGAQPLTKVFYSDSGSTAVEVALKIAFQHWRQRGKPKKNKFVALSEAYHGDTLGAVSAGGMDLFHQIFQPLLFDVLRVPTPYAYRWPTGPRHCLDAAALAAETLLHSRRDEIAAMVIEPIVQGAGGMIMHPKGYLSRIAKACRDNGVLLICDEVATGFGRTGTLFACEQEGVVPDLLCTAKGLSAGYLPLAATLATDAIYESFLGPFESKRTFFHGHSYTGNALACAAALANLRLFDEERTLAHVNAMAQRLAEGLAPMAKLKHVGEVRQRGLMVGIELVKDKKSKEEFPYGERVGHRICLAARKRELLLRPLGNVLVLMPPLSISPQEVDLLVEGVSASIVEVTQG